MEMPPLLAGVLDDEPEMRKALRRLLTGCGVGVEEFANGRDLIAMLASRTLDVLLLDLHMPAFSGFDVLEALSTRRVSFPVIVITAKCEEGTSDRLRSLGAFTCLEKPIDRDVLLSAIEAAITPHRLRPRVSPFPR